MFHAVNSVHLQYKKGAFDNFDTIFCVGQHHVDEIRKTEALYDLKPKELVNIGYSWLEDLEEQYLALKDSYDSVKKKIIIAPTWSRGNILETCIHSILEKLIPLNYDIIVRPHPEFIKRNKKDVHILQNRCVEIDNVSLETSSSSSTNIIEASLLITDWSGIAIEFIWGMNKPVIYIDTLKKIENNDYKELDIEPIEDQIRNLNENVLEVKECKDIDIIINNILKDDHCISETQLALKRNNIFNWGSSSDMSADYIVNYLEKTE